MMIEREQYIVQQQLFIHIKEQIVLNMALQKQDNIPIML